MGDSRMSREERVAFGQRFRDWRMSAGLKRSEVLTILGDGAPSDSTLRNIEGGHQAPGKSLCALLEALMNGVERPNSLSSRGMHGSGSRGQSPSSGVPEPATIKRIIEASRQERVSKAAEALANATGQSIDDALSIVISERLKNI